MLTGLSTIIIILASVFSALAFLLLLRHRWTPARMREANDATSFYIAVVGTIYAVILAFMLSSVWAEFQNAMINTEQEANALVNIFRLAEPLPDFARNQIQEAARDYARTMIVEEWPAMAHEEVSMRGSKDVENLWHAVTMADLTKPSEQAAVHQALTELAKMTEHRRIRQLQSRFKLPVILWLVLIFGGVATVANSCLLGVENARLHILYIVSLTCLVALVLVAIAEIDRPFQGSVHVSSNSFEMALMTFDRATGK